MAKTGRNDPCPCGSGKKYKHCCYAEKHQPSMPTLFPEKTQIGTRSAALKVNWSVKS